MAPKRAIVGLFEAEFGSSALANTQTGLAIQATGIAPADVLAALEAEFGSHALENSRFAAALRTF